MHTLVEEGSLTPRRIRWFGFIFALTVIAAMVLMGTGKGNALVRPPALHLVAIVFVLVAAVMIQPIKQEEHERTVLGLSLAVTFAVLGTDALTYLVQLAFRHKLWAPWLVIIVSLVATLICWGAVLFYTDSLYQDKNRKAVNRATWFAIGLMVAVLILYRLIHGL